MWTRFVDMHSGGRCKEKPYEKIYIEAPQNEAEVIFYNRFGHNPNRVSCTCCGEDYSVSESESLEQASAYNRGCRWDEAQGVYVEQWCGKDYYPYLTVSQYIQEKTVLVIPAKEIKPSEREGTLPRQGYVWVD